MDVEISRIDDDVPGLLAELADASSAEGHGHIRRLVDDWTAGTNRFSAPGEALFVARAGDRVVGVCGLNIDPFTDAPRTGRVRRLFIDPAARRSGTARRLVSAVEAAAAGHFDTLRVRAPVGDASLFYVACGYVPCTGHAVTHTKDIA